MKFECGKRANARLAYLQEWHRFYPWFPREVGENDCRAFEWIERKGELILGEVWVWQYRLPTTTLIAAKHIMKEAKG